MKKQLFLILLIIFGTLSIKSQDLNIKVSTVDSLCTNSHSNKEGRNPAYNISAERWMERLSFISDPLMPLERKYTEFYPYSPITSGWYGVVIGSHEFTPSSSQIPGIVFLNKYDFSDAYYKLIKNIDSFFIFGVACFFDGVPCCRWEYETTSYFRSCPEETRKTLADSLAVLTEVDFSDGLMHGEYIVSNFDRKKNSVSGVLYQTIFENGTGYYKDFFPDGVLRIEGAVKEGYADGLWHFYIRRCEEYTGVILAEYKNGERLSQQEFFSKEEVDKQIREAIEKKEAEKKRKRNIFSFLKKKK